MSITPFATVEDIESRWKTLTTSEAARAQALLIDATARITALCKSAGVDLTSPDEVLAANLIDVTCSVVRRAMSAPVDVPSMSAMSMAAGPYSQSVTVSNPMGNLYLTKDDERLLGLFCAKGSTIRMAIHNIDGSEVDGW